MKLPAFMFYPGDWLTDPALSLCTPATRGVWIDLLCAIHKLNRGGELRGTTEQLARIARCLPVQLIEALTDLQATGTADVSERNGVFTILSRRMARDAKEREQWRLRQQKRRGFNNVTLSSRGSPAVSSYSSSIDKNTTCFYCGATPQNTGVGFEVDHFLPLSAGGTDDSENLHPCCHVCNQAKGARVFNSVEECRRYLHAAYWSSNRKRWIEHRKVAFGGKPPSDYRAGDRIPRGGRTAVPAEFEVTDEMKSWAEANAPGVDLPSTTTKFILHHKAKGSVMRDWRSAWELWVMNAKTWSSGNGSKAKSDPVGSSSHTTAPACELCDGTGRVMGIIDHPGGAVVMRPWSEVAALYYFRQEKLTQIYRCPCSPDDHSDLKLYSVGASDGLP